MEASSSVLIIKTSSVGKTTDQDSLIIVDEVAPWQERTIVPCTRCGREKPEGSWCTCATAEEIRATDALLRWPDPIRKAFESVISFARVTLGPDQTREPLLEEIGDAGEDLKNSWLITVSFMLPDTSGGRAYRTFTVRKGTGEVITMNIRDLSHV